MKWFKEKVLGVLLKWSGASYAWEKVSGYKTYAAGAGLLLSGLGAIATDVSQVASLPDLLSFVKSLPQSSDWVQVLGGLAAIGLRHAKEKSDKGADGK